MPASLKRKPPLANAIKQPNDKVFAGGSATFNEAAPYNPAPAAPGQSPADMEKQRAKLEMEMKRSTQGSDRQKAFADKLASQRTAIQTAKTAAGQPLTHAQGVTGQQMVDTLGKRAETTKQPSQDYSRYQRLSPGVYRAPDGSLYNPPGGVLPKGSPAAQKPIAKRPGTTQPQGAEPDQQVGIPRGEIPQRIDNGGVVPPGQNQAQPPPGNQQPPSGNPQQPPGSPNQANNPNFPSGQNPGSQYGVTPSLPGYNWQDGSFNGGANPQSQQAPGQARGMPGAPAVPSQGQSPESMLGGIYNQATGGTINSFDTAANRLRERLDSSSQAALDQNATRNVGRGFGNSGAVDQGIYQINQGSQQAYTNGLNDLSNAFETQRQEGLKTGLGAANGAANFTGQKNALQQLDQSQTRGLNNSNYQQFQDLFTGLLNNREGRGSAEKISGNELANRLAMQQGDQTFQGGQNDLNRSLQENLARMGFQFQGQEGNANRKSQEGIYKDSNNSTDWRSALGQLFNNTGGSGSSSGGMDLSKILSGSSGSSFRPSTGAGMGGEVPFYGPSEYSR